MANIMSMVKLRNNPSRNGFDLSNKLAYSAKIGELLPVSCIECIPGDRVEGRVQHFTRTLPVESPAYTRIREYYDWFFVPTNLMWNKFNTFVTQMSDNNLKAQSISASATTGTRQPWFTTKQIYDYLKGYQGGAMLPYRNNFFGYDRPLLTSKLLDYLGYGQYYNAAFVSDSEKYPSTAALGQASTAKALNPFPLLAYQKIYQDFYRNSQWENANAPACNIDYMNDKDNMQLPIDNVDYTAENMFDLRYCNWNKDYFMGVLPNSQYGDEATVDISSLLSDVQYGNFSMYISNSVGGVLPIGSTLKSDAQIQGRQANLVLADAEGTANDAAVSLAFTPTTASRLRTILGLPASSSNGSLFSAFSILALRQAEAAQKWKEITQSAQQDYASQVEAHFGVSVSDAYSDRCKFIDGMVNTLDINEVVNQSLNGEDVAAIKGKGVGTGDGKFTFETKVHGYLMCIYHAVPILDFQTTGIRKVNTKVNVTDYAIPEFDKTGMVKIHASELFNELSLSQTNYGNFLLGYAPQYYEYKTSYDEIKGAFAYGGLQSWVAPLTYKYIQDYFESVSDQLGQPMIEYHFFKVNPSILNPIFVPQIEGDSPSSASSETETDQLLINCAFDLKAVRNLDRNGLPY